MERHSAATAGGYMTYQDKDIGQLIKRIAQLEAALDDTEYPVSEVLALTRGLPLFGHRNGKSTHWVVFMKGSASIKETK
jgi:hypothetical protein